jgi:hypothetical protein
MVPPNRTTPFVRDPSMLRASASSARAVSLFAKDRINAAHFIET